MEKKTAIIIGAGPAGLTAAYELLHKTSIVPIIYEASDELGGLARTINYKGNRIDIGGHRFFSKSDRVMRWWENILPFEDAASGISPETTDKIMLARDRLSRIFFLRKFFDYPITLNANTIFGLGLARLFVMGLGYLKIKLFPIKPEQTLEDFFINRFGKGLYRAFFKDYTEKVWGVPCEKISPEWGAQRVKGLSITKALADFLKTLLSKPSSVSQKNIETSLIRRFLYPKYGPGQIWEETAKIIKEKGGEILLRHAAAGFCAEGDRIMAVKIKDLETGEIKICRADYFFSTMPIKDLVAKITPAPDEQVWRVAANLPYRDFITVGLLLKKWKNGKTDAIPDNWIYIQEKDVKVGRLQIFNNWSSYLVKDPDTIWVGLEYFCNEGDELWNKTDSELMDFAIGELSKLGMIDKEDALDGTVIRAPKAYPAYFGAYKNFSVVKDFLDGFENLFLIGRNGMHKYNNQDHSMLTAMTAVENIINNIKSKNNIWDINIEESYHENK